MTPERLLMLIGFACALATAAQIAPPVREALGVVYAVQALRAHRRLLNGYVKPSATNRSSTARCASSIA
jgi:hypothetical protein